MKVKSREKVRTQCDQQVASVWDHPLSAMTLSNFEYFLYQSGVNVVQHMVQEDVGLEIHVLTKGLNEVHVEEAHLLGV